MFNAAGNMDLKAMEDILNNKGVDVNYTCSSLNYRTVLHELVIGMYNIDIISFMPYCKGVKLGKGLVTNYGEGGGGYKTGGGCT